MLYIVVLTVGKHPLLGAVKKCNSSCVFQNGGAKDGYDMNISPAWQKGYTGKGVVVSILDDGIQTNHPDLALNYVRTNSIVADT